MLRTEYAVEILMVKVGSLVTIPYTRRVPIFLDTENLEYIV